MKNVYYCIIFAISFCSLPLYLHIGPLGDRVEEPGRSVPSPRAHLQGQVSVSVLSSLDLTFNFIHISQTDRTAFET